MIITSRIEIKKHFFSARFVNMNIANTAAKCQVLQNEECIRQCSFDLFDNVEDQLFLSVPIKTVSSRPSAA